MFTPYTYGCQEEGLGVRHDVALNEPSHLVREMSYVTQEGILKALRLVLFG
jgi:hypothetical protein